MRSLSSLTDQPAKRQKIAFITADEAATKAISKKERLVASRKSILNCKRDLTDMMELFQKHTQELEKEKRRQQAEQADNTMRQLRNARYDKEHDTQKYWKEKTGSGSPSLLFLSVSLASVNTLYFSS